MGKRKLTLAEIRAYQAMALAARQLRRAERLAARRRARVIVGEAREQQPREAAHV